MIMQPLFRPPFFVRNPGRLEIRQFMYLSILAQLNFPIPKRPIEIKSEALATYSPWKFPAEISLSSSNPSSVQQTNGLSVAPFISQLIIFLQKSRDSSKDDKFYKDWVIDAAFLFLWAFVRQNWWSYDSYKLRIDLRYLRVLPSDGWASEQNQTDSSLRSYGSSPKISTAKAQIKMAEDSRCLDIVSTSETILDINCVPLISASPSFSFNTIGFNPFLPIISAASPNCPFSSHQANPSPIIPRARCESGARSPEAPTVPFSGIIGIQLILQALIYFYRFSGSIPLRPLHNVLMRSTIIRLTVAKGNGFPTHTECDLIRLFCNLVRSSQEIILSAKLPNPVLIPYTIFLLSLIMLWIAYRLFFTLCQASSVRPICKFQFIIMSRSVVVRVQPSSRQVVAFLGMFKIYICLFCILYNPSSNRLVIMNDTNYHN